MDLVKLKLVVAYDGTHYAGWQVQKTGLGVQEKLQQAVRCLFPGAEPLQGSSRTDAGVHALGMVAHVEVPRLQLKIPDRKLALAINSFLPQDIRVVEAKRCRSGFHARFDARAKQYRYFVWNHRVSNPLLRHQAWHVPQTLNLPAMRSAAPLLLGRHDFKSFAANRNYEMESTVRTLTRCDIQRRGPLLTFILEGDGFLYRMCRGIVGTLIQIGRGKYTRDDLRRILAARDRSAAGMTAPAAGLVLWKVDYTGPRRVRPPLASPAATTESHANRPG